MKNILRSILFGISFYSTQVFGQITLEECQTKARENFPLIQQYELIEQTREYTLSNAGKAFLPQLDVTLIGGVIEGLPSFGAPGSESSSTEFNMISMVQFNQVIWDGGLTKASKAATTANAEIEKANLEVSLYSLEERVNNLFFGVLLIEEQIAQMEILKSTLQRNMKRVEVAVENGTAFKSDIDEIKVEVINVDQKVAELQFNKKAYLNVLAAMIGETIPPKTKLERPAIDDSFIALENNRPELNLYQNQEFLIEAKSNIDKAMLYPKIGIMGIGTFIQPGVDFGTSKLNNILVGGLSLNWTLGNLYQNNNNKKLTEINLQKVKVQRETFLFNTNLELTQTQQELDKFKTLIDQDKELLTLKSGIKQAYEVKYENGVSTMSQLLDKVNDENAAKQNLIMHEIQYLMKVYQYKNKSGN
ncbi:TolC family protein [Flexithrix dorotheae]|uniref:TolC family protein n=1 Tax=Flexithrix dorotheae TaxID=70993 RepID=UPI00036C1E70|nr:TolC family protein [Flexithrix dorotheae]